MTIRAAGAADFAIVADWLTRARLPVADLSDEDMENFLLAESGGEPVGVIGLEPLGDIGLLRSLVVSPGERGNGTGRKLVAALEAAAAARGIVELWLLTTDAKAYFKNLGWVVVDREDAPQRIRETTEFAKLCPSSAVLMRNH